MRRKYWRIVVVLSLVAGACGSSTPVSTPADTGPATATTLRATTTVEVRAQDLPEGEDRVVERVVDGDTIVVDGGERVRLIGIDTPETKDPRRPVECFGREASAFMESLLPRGTAVRLVFDVERLDRYDRTLAYVYRAADSLFVNLELALQGYAQPATYPPNVAHTYEFVAAAAEARDARRGLWAACPDDAASPTA